MCFGGCATQDPNYSGIVEDNPLSEEEIIQYVKDYMLKKYEDEVEVKITGKYNLTHTTAYSSPALDGSKSRFGGKYAKIKNGHTYNLEITNIELGITTSGTYKDGFELTNKQIDVTEVIGRSVGIDDTYSIMKNEILFEEEANELLKTHFSKFKFYKDPTNYKHSGSGYYNIYVYCVDDSVISEAMRELIEIDYKKYYSIAFEIRAFIFNDEDFYDSFDFDYCNNIEIAKTDSKEIKEYYPGKLADSDVKNKPQMLIEKYLNTELTYITTCENLDHDIFITKGLSGYIKGKENGNWYNKEISEETIENFDQVLFIYKGNPQKYKNSLEKGKSNMQYGTTNVYGLNLLNF